MDDDSAAAGAAGNTQSAASTNRTSHWQHFEIVANVDKDALRLDFGLLVFGGREWIADPSFGILGDAADPVMEPARPLTSRGLRNETAFARLFGYIRYFHPSDEASHISWESRDTLKRPPQTVLI